MSRDLYLPLWGRWLVEPDEVIPSPLGKGDRLRWMREKDLPLWGRWQKADLVIVGFLTDEVLTNPIHFHILKSARRGVTLYAAQ